MKKYILTLLFALMAAVAAQAQSYEHFQENLKEAKAGNRLAQYNVGLYYHNGWSGVKQDYQQAAYWYRKSADQGYADAQLNLGYLYEKGLGVSQDSQQAVYWYRKAAEQGNVSAMFNLGSCYHDGNGVTQDCQQAVYWSRKAAEQGHGAAMCRLGNCYYEGECVDQDYQQAVYWYRKAADQGVSSGMNSLGHCYKDGNGVTQDYQQAVYWYRKADEQGSAAAKYNLAVCYYYGEGVGQDYEKAYELTLEALEEMDDPEEMALPYNLLAIFYDNGQGVAKDEEMAEELYKLAISYGSMEAKANLGGVYYNKGDYTEAFPLLSDAAADGLNSAQYLLGCMYRSGSGVTKNEDIAIRWYKLAAAQGHEKAIACLDDMYFDEEAPEAFDWVKKRAQEGDAYSQYRLGKFYMEGTVVEQDYDEAKKWLDKAAQQDNVQAIVLLEAKSNAKIWKKVETDRKRAEAKADREYRLWKFGKYMSTFNCPKGYTRPFGVSVGYVSKRWENIWSGGSKEHSSVFDDTKLINGVQAGVRWEPQLKYGFGFDTGLYYEYYQDKSDMMDDGDGYGPYFVRMSEHCLHFPAHVEYRLNFTEDFQVFFYGGVALDFVLYGKFDYFDEGYDEPFGTLDEEIYAGEVLPDVKRFNASWSFGGGVRFMAFQLNAGTRMGFYNMSSSPDYKVYQNNPFLISLSFMF